LDKQLRSKQHRKQRASIPHAPARPFKNASTSNDNHPLHQHPNTPTPH
jgi:hypothetical protein